MWLGPGLISGAGCNSVQLASCSAIATPASFLQIRAGGWGAPVNCRSTKAMSESVLGWQCDRGEEGRPQLGGKSPSKHLIATVTVMLFNLHNFH